MRPSSSSHSLLRVPSGTSLTLAENRRYVKEDFARRKDGMSRDVSATWQMKKMNRSSSQFSLGSDDGSRPGTPSRSWKLPESGSASPLPNSFSINSLSAAGSPVQQPYQWKAIKTLPSIKDLPAYHPRSQAHLHTKSRRHKFDQFADWIERVESAKSQARKVIVTPASIFLTVHKVPLHAARRRHPRTQSLSVAVAQCSHPPRTCAPPARHSRRREQRRPSMLVTDRRRQAEAAAGDPERHRNSGRLRRNWPSGALS